jgi:hypothetical protein
MTLAIIDGDVLAYGACKPRWEKKVKQVDMGNGTIASIRQLDADGKPVALEYSKAEDTEYLMQSWDNFKKDLDILLSAVFCDDYVMAVKGLDNFRDIVYSEYKLQRRAPAHDLGKFVPSIRELAVFEGYAIAANGREADDLLCIWAEEARKAGQDYVICSIDKDLKCIPGKHYLMHKKTMIEVSEYEALKFQYQQLLTGDATDNIPGIPGVGPVKAANFLSDCLSEDEMQVVVVELYKAVFQDEWREYLLSNGKMLYLQRHYNDYFTLENWPIVKEI